MIDATRCPNLDGHSPRCLSLLWLGNTCRNSLSCNLHDGTLVIIVMVIVIVIVITSVLLSIDIDKEVGKAPSKVRIGRSFVPF